MVSWLYVEPLLLVHVLKSIHWPFFVSMSYCSLVTETSGMSHLLQLLCHQHQSWSFLQELPGHLLGSWSSTVTRLGERKWQALGMIYCKLLITNTLKIEFIHGSFHHSPKTHHQDWTSCCGPPQWHGLHLVFPQTPAISVSEIEAPRVCHVELHKPCRQLQFLWGYFPLKKLLRDHSQGTLPGSRFLHGNDHKQHCQCAAAATQAHHWARPKHRGHACHLQLPGS